MLGQATAYALKRLTSDAVEHVSREFVWLSIAVALALCGFVFALIAGYWFVQPILGPAKAAAVVGAGCAVVAAVCFFMPSIIERMKSKAEPTLPPGVTPLSVAKDEVKAAVDFFGPLRLVSSAFAFGLGLGRRLKRRSSRRRAAVALVEAEPLYWPE
jgi:hypothetical protein